jgi:YHS domain-containing protein
MLNYLLRALFVFSAVLVLWRFVRGLIGGAFRRSVPQAGPPGRATPMVKDPVCGMFMDARLALRAERGSQEHFFCSEECRSKFLAESAP